MLEAIQSLDEKLFLFLNGLHNAFFDQFFYWVSNRWIWLPLYAYLFYLYYKNYRSQMIAVMAAVTLLIFFSDQTASSVLKIWVMRLRPCHDPEIQNQVHLVNGYCGGMYGFVSSHAANVFALATFFFFTLGKKYPRVAALLFFIAILVSYSRIYLGAHYPGDILGGALVGAVYAFVIYRVFRKKLTTTDPSPAPSPREGRK